MRAEGTAGADNEAVAPDIERAMARCRSEIAEIERLLRSGHPDVEGLCLGLSDWSAELRILKRERERSSIPNPDPGNRPDLRPHR
ncbi:MAG: hypothetical protein M1570_12130, partial [Chloroflexi bacterium]|nr:hypothetical protein [Chloroflexota bacterium]